VTRRVGSSDMTRPTLITVRLESLEESENIEEDKNLEDFTRLL
jgi:hypothetical protein